jgi:membrane-associated phospholipid phosphatase
MLTDHRRAFRYAAALVGALLLLLLAVGRQPPESAPHTTLHAIGAFDQRVYDWMGSIHNMVLNGLFRFLNVAGGGVITIPLRAVASLVLLIRRRWRAFAAFGLTWAFSEIGLTILKTYFHRGRPPAPLVSTAVTFSFPSGHAVAGAATAVALVLAFFPPGARRRKWEWMAVAFAFVMAFSRVYLNAHWFSDVVAGVLLGAGVALASAAVVTEVRDIWFRRHGIAIPPPDVGSLDPQPAAGDG